MIDIKNKEQKLKSNWRDDSQRVIGCYSKKDGSETYCLKDIRSLGFSERKYKGGEEIVIEVDKNPKLKEDVYYEFEWTIKEEENDRGFCIVPKNNIFKEVKPKELVDRLYKVWENSGEEVINQMADIQRMVSTQLTASSEGTFVYELLQNANDYPVELNGHKQLVDVEFHLTDKYLIYQHTGRLFSPRNIAAISRTAAGEKKKEKNAIGYKGIGFKTVFNDNEYVLLKSGEYTLRFDEAITEVSENFPWQLMPIWTPVNDVEQEVLRVINNSSSDFRVQMAIRPKEHSKLRECEKSYEYIFNDIFKDEKDILFIPYIKSVKVFYDGKEQICRIKDPSKWMLSEPYKYSFNTEEIEENNSEVIINKRVPEKYKDFLDTRVSFACKIEGSCLLPIENARLYCYLPTQISFGFPFLMNTDMIPTGPRDDIEMNVKLNMKIANIAGHKFYEWIYDLLKTGKYDYDSIYSLIPDFEDCKAKHDKYVAFISEFEKGFTEEIKENKKPIVPVLKDSQIDILSLEDVNYDSIGISCVKELLTDEQILTFSNRTGYFPLPELRDFKKNVLKTNFKKFIGRYYGITSKFEWNHLEECFDCQEFVEWLKQQDNNNRFIDFLLKKDKLQEFIDEKKKLFIKEECGNLYKAEELYYDVDDELTDLSAFSNFIFYLSLKTRGYFKGNKKWEKLCEGKFAKFDANKFVKENLLSSSNLPSTIEKLKDWDTSYHFYNFVARKAIYDEGIAGLPFFNNDVKPTAIDNFNDKFVFYSSKKGTVTFGASWLSGIAVAFVSSKYNKRVLEYFGKNLGVIKFDDSVVVKKIILGEKYADKINAAQQQEYANSEDFVRYCFLHKDLFDENSLKNYALSTIDKKFEYDYILSEDHIYFPSDKYDEFSSKGWIDNGWMYCLDPDYFNGYSFSEQKSLKSFINKAFGVEELDNKTFYEQIVKNHTSDIVSNTSGDNDADGSLNIDFISYLDANYTLIFEKIKDEELFANFVLISDDNYKIDKESTYVYSFDNELKEILDSEWFPENLVSMCSHRYGNSKAILKIKAKKYEFKTFFDEVIKEELSTINDNIDSKEKSIAFHNFIITNKSDLTDKQKDVMKGAKLYLYGSDEACEASSGHKLLSQSARDLFDKGLVEFADMDIIDPEYKPEDNLDYWTTCLGNSAFTVQNFLTWLNSNIDTFAETITDKGRNLAFWKWLKGKKMEDSTIKNIPSLPIFLTDGKTATKDDGIYLSDNYIKEGGIETIVRKYQEKALFISRDYMDADDNVEEWAKFWIKIGVLSEIIDILTNSVIPRLGEIEIENLPATLARYRDKLDKVIENLPSKLKDLRVKAYDGNFYSIAEAIYVDCVNEEPFKYIELPNQITFETADERRLVESILKGIGKKPISDLKEWRGLKVSRYLSWQNENVELIRDKHYAFIAELVVLYKNSSDIFVEELKEQLAKVKLLDKEGKFVEAKTLTFSSAYHYYCDFEGHGVPEANDGKGLHYISDSYLSNCHVNVNNLFNFIFNVHCYFGKDDIQFLANRKFAIYFWSDYVHGSITQVKSFIEGHLFDKIACIPTKDYMKRPDELYSPDIDDYVTCIDDWENKKPLKFKPAVYEKAKPVVDGEKQEKDKDLFGLLNFKKSLSFEDSLMALTKIKGQVRRSQLGKWLVESDDSSCDKLVEEYRAKESSIWKNVNDNYVHITDLYALDSDGKLYDLFGTNHHIINANYMPGGEQFKKLCDILKIKTIKEEDIDMNPGKDFIETPEEERHDLLLYALAIAGKEGIDNWQTRYKDYSQKVDKIRLYKCKSISMQYKKNEEINQKFKQFYHKESSNEFYYVDSLNDSLVYLYFVKEFVKYLGAKIAEDLVNFIMRSREKALSIVRDDIELMQNEEFINKMNELVPGFKQEKVTHYEDEDDIVEDTRGEISSIDKYFHGEGVNNEDHVSSDENIDQKTSNEFSEPSTSELSSEFNSNNSSELNHSDFDSSSQSFYEEKDNGVVDDNEEETLNEDSITDETQAYGGNHNDSNRHSKQSSSKDTSNRYNGSYGGSTNSGKQSQPRTYREPKPYTKEDVERLKSHGVSRCLSEANGDHIEIEHINTLLGVQMDEKDIADTHFLVRSRLYQTLKDRQLEPDQSEKDFIKTSGHTVGGKIIKACSATYGIFYISPAMWNKVARGECIICVYLSKRSKDFILIESIQDILTWVHEDDIIIKLIGKEKSEVVKTLYSGVLNGVTATAYTMVRIGSNSAYSPVFTSPIDDPDQQDSLDEL